MMNSIQNTAERGNYQIRNTKLETNSNEQNLNDQIIILKLVNATVCDFEHLNFDIVSNFEFRDSDFEF